MVADEIMYGTKSATVSYWDECMYEKCGEDSQISVCVALRREKRL